jgi:hypothetical protein
LLNETEATKMYEKESFAEIRMEWNGERKLNARCSTHKVEAGGQYNFTQIFASSR